MGIDDGVMTGTMTWAICRQDVMRWDGVAWLLYIDEMNWNITYHDIRYMRSSFHGQSPRFHARRKGSPREG